MDASNSRPSAYCQISIVLALFVTLFLVEERTGIIRQKRETLHRWGRNRGGSNRTSSSNHNRAPSISHNKTFLRNSTAPSSAEVNTASPTSPSSTISCQRKCTVYNNRIVYKGGEAGIDDRLELMYGLSSLAAFLCAKLVVPPPHQFLGKFHTRQRVATNLTWEHNFATYYLLANGEQAIIEESKKVEHETPNTTGHWELTFTEYEEFYTSFWDLYKNTTISNKTFTLTLSYLNYWGFVYDFCYDTLRTIRRSF